MDEGAGTALTSMRPPLREGGYSSYEIESFFFLSDILTLLGNIFGFRLNKPLRNMRNLLCWTFMLSSSEP